MRVGECKLALAGTALRFRGLVGAPLELAAEVRLGLARLLLGGDRQLEPALERRAGLGLLLRRCTRVLALRDEPAAQVGDRLRQRADLVGRGDERDALSLELAANRLERPPRLL